MNSSEKFISLQHSLMEIGQANGFLEQPHEIKLRKIIKSCAQQLNSARVSVWSLTAGQTAVFCEVLYLKDANHYESGALLHATQCPNYFNALKQDRLIVADDARQHPLTTEFSDTYLAPLGIHSLLDVPIFSCGDRYGVLCIEHTGTPRQWQVEELSYATAVADKISLINEYESWLRTRKKLEFLQHTDNLTGLENRVSFQQRLDRALHKKSQLMRPCALIIAGIDNFTSINDLWGHQKANQVLCTLASRFEALAQEQHCKLARLGGDNFAYWLPRLKNSDHLETFLDALNGLVRKPIKTQAGNTIEISACYGVVAFPLSTESIDDPIRCAEIAMQRAKQQGGGQTSFFTPDWLSEYQQKRLLEEEFYQALNSDQIIPFYQPIIDSDTHTCVGLEALARWQHPEKGTLPPLHFLPIARELGLMVRLGEVILDRVCSDMQKLRSQGLEIEWVSVNLAAEQLYNSNLVFYISKLLKQYTLPGEILELEIVEELIGLESEIVTEQIHALADLGIGLSIDDFGTGYSSMSRLKHLPVTKLKIDKSFVDGLPLGEDDQCITESILGLAKGMKIKTVAEGVETAAQARWLAARECTYLQGFHFAKPMSYTALHSYLDNASRLDKTAL